MAVLMQQPKARTNIMAGMGHKHNGDSIEAQLKNLEESIKKTDVIPEEKKEETNEAGGENEGGEVETPQYEGGEDGAM